VPYADERFSAGCYYYSTTVVEIRGPPLSGLPRNFSTISCLWQREISYLSAYPFQSLPASPREPLMCGHFFSTNQFYHLPVLPVLFLNTFFILIRSFCIKYETRECESVGLSCPQLSVTVMLEPVTGSTSVMGGYLKEERGRGY